MGGRGGSGPATGPAASPTAAASGGDREWWQDDEVASAIIQAYVDVNNREHISTMGIMVPANAPSVGVAVKDIREQMTKHGANFSRESVDETMRKIFRGGSMGTAYGTVFPSAFTVRGKDPMEYRRAGFQMGGQEKSFVLLTRGSNLPRPRSS